MLCIAGKVPVGIILNRINTCVADSAIPESQGSVVLHGRGTSDVVFAIHQLQEKCEQNMKLHIVFMDLTNAFDAVSRKGLHVEVPIGKLGSRIKVSL